MSVDNKSKTVLALLLRGSQLDSIRIHSIELTLTFLQKIDDKLEYVYLSTSANFEVSKTKTTKNSNGCNDFFEHRASFLGKLYMQLGRDVDDCDVGENGAPFLKIGTDLISFYPDETDNYEEVWSVFDGEEAYYGTHNILVGLNDQLEVTVTSET